MTFHITHLPLTSLCHEPSLSSALYLRGGNYKICPLLASHTERICATITLIVTFTILTEPHWVLCNSHKPMMATPLHNSHIPRLNCYYCHCQHGQSWLLWQATYPVQSFTWPHYQSPSCTGQPSACSACPHRDTCTTAQSLHTWTSPAPALHAHPSDTQFTYIATGDTDHRTIDLCIVPRTLGFPFLYHAPWALIRKPWWLNIHCGHKHTHEICVTLQFGHPSLTLTHVPHCQNSTSIHSTYAHHSDTVTQSWSPTPTYIPSHCTSTNISCRRGISIHDAATFADSHTCTSHVFMQTSSKPQYCWVHICIIPSIQV